jgi:hypothetical protein
VATIETRILGPDAVAAPLPASGKLPAIAEAFLSEEELEANETAIATTCAVRRPRKFDIFRVRPGAEWRRHALLVDYHGESDVIGRGPFLIHPSLRSHFGTFGEPHLLLTCTTPAANLFIWPVRLVEGFGSGWCKSALTIAQMAESQWVRMWSAKGSHGYLAAVSRHAHGEPRWRGESFEELAAMAFEGNFVTSLDHALCQVLEVE